MISLAFMQTALDLGSAQHGAEYTVLALINAAVCVGTRE